MKKFEGKKLLLLGSNVGTEDMILYAKSNGAYTIVADNLPVSKSGANTSLGTLFLKAESRKEMDLIINNMVNYIKIKFQYFFRFLLDMFFCQSVYFFGIVSGKV